MNIDALPGFCLSIENNVQVDTNDGVSTWTNTTWLPEPPGNTSNVFVKSNTTLVLDTDVRVKGIAG